jgi:hypothetical protein
MPKKSSLLNYIAHRINIINPVAPSWVSSNSDLDSSTAERLHLKPISE